MGASIFDGVYWTPIVQVIPAKVLAFLAGFAPVRGGVRLVLSTQLQARLSAV